MPFKNDISASLLLQFFKDGSSGTGNDYVYDDNGNLVADLNKEIKNVAGANGIVYNYLDKPEQIKIMGKGTINITYDADGSKLRRIFTAETGATKVTTYINEYVYEETNTIPIAAQFISFEEGRIRPVTPRNEDNGLDAISMAGNITLPNGRKGRFQRLMYNSSPILIAWKVRFRQFTKICF